MSTDISTVDPVHDLRSRIANPAVTFGSDDDVQALVDYVRQQALTQSEGVDASTSAGRRTLISVAARVAKSRAFLKAQAGEVVKSLRNQIADVNLRADRMVETLDEARDRIRQPVTDWEAAEEARVNALRAKVAEIRSLGIQAAHRFTTVEEIDKADKEVALMLAIDFQEFSQDAQESIAATRQALQQARESLVKRQEEAREKEELKRKLAEAEEANRKAAELQEILRIVQRLHDVSAEASTGRQDPTWITAMREVIEPYRGHHNGSVVLAFQMAEKALSQAWASYEMANADMAFSKAQKPSPLPGQTPSLPDAGSAKETPKEFRARLATTMNDRDVILELLHAAGPAFDLLDELWRECRDGRAKPDAITDLEHAIDVAEAYLKR